MGWGNSWSYSWYLGIRFKQIYKPTSGWRFIGHYGLGGGREREEEQKTFQKRGTLHFCTQKLLLTCVFFLKNIMIEIATPSRCTKLFLLSCSLDRLDEAN